MANTRFESWLGEHLGLLQRIARGFAYGADQPDLFQELCLAVWRAEPAFRGDSDPRTFVFRVAHNAALTWKRRERRRFAQQSEYERLFDSAQSDQDPLVEQLYAAIRTLPSVDRSLVLLWLEGQSYAQIAEVHGISETNVGARLTRARKKLTLAVENHDE